MFAVNMVWQVDEICFLLSLHQEAMADRLRRHLSFDPDTVINRPNTAPTNRLLHQRRRHSTPHSAATSTALDSCNACHNAIETPAHHSPKSKGLLLLPWGASGIMLHRRRPRHTILSQDRMTRREQFGCLECQKYDPPPPPLFIPQSTLRSKIENSHLLPVKDVRNVQRYEEYVLAVVFRPRLFHLRAFSHFFERCGSYGSRFPWSW